MKIRKSSGKDLKKILELNQAAVPHVSNVEMADMEYFLENAEPFLVIEEEEVLAGFMIVLQAGLDYPSLNYRFFCGNYSDFDYVDRIVIGEKFRGKKFGTSLYHHLFEHSDKKLVTCEVNVRPPNPTSMAFHTAMGFKEVAQQKTENGAKRVSLMIKKL